MMLPENNLGTPIVVDVGTYTTKIGFSGEKTPRAIVRSLLAKDPATGEWLFGDDVLPVIDQVTLHRPIDNGHVQDYQFGDFYRFLSHLIAEELQVHAADHPLVLIVDSKGLVSWDDIAHRLFSKLESPAICMVKSGMACLHALGETTATIVHVGAGHTIVAPLLNGYGNARTIPRLWIGAQKDVDAALHRQLVARGALPDTPGGLELARQVKEQVCYTPLSFDEEKKEAESGNFTSTATAKLPDGTEIDCGIERFYGPEVFFNPGINDLDFVGLDTVIKNCILNGTDCYWMDHWDFRRSADDWHAALASKIVLVGGHVSMPGFADRIKNSVAAMLPGVAVETTIPEPREYFEWYSGSLIAESGNLRWVSQEAWIDAGKSYKKATTPLWE